MPSSGSPQSLPDSLINISVVIPNLNGAKLLEDCIGSLNRQTYDGFEIIFVDDGSIDHSVLVARQLSPSIRILEMGRNCGFAAASNAGITMARGEFVFLLNNDTELAPDCLAELAAVAYGDLDVGMIAPKILNHYDRRVIDSVGGLVMTLDAVANGRGRGEIDNCQYDDVRESFFPSACAALYRRKMLADVGLLAEDFFAYCEDTDLGLRARWAGWRAASAPSAVVYHKYSQTAGAQSTRKLYLVERNRVAAALRNFPLLLLPLVALVSIYRYVLMAIAALTARGRGKAATETGTAALAIALVRAWRDALGRAPVHLAIRPAAKRISALEFTRLIWRHRLPIRRLVFTD